MSDEAKKLKITQQMKSIKNVEKINKCPDVQVIQMVNNEEKKNENLNVQVI